MKNIVVIGVGIMGNGIVCVFVMNGYFVNLIDIFEEVFDKVFDIIMKNFDCMFKKEWIMEEVKQKMFGNLIK